MDILILIFVLALLFGWSGGAFVWHAGSFIHLLLLLAVIVIVLRVASGRPWTWW